MAAEVLLVPLFQFSRVNRKVCVYEHDSCVYVCVILKNTIVFIQFDVIRRGTPREDTRVSPMISLLLNLI